jgi:carbon storage regulator
MLVLSRKPGEEIVIGGNIRVMVVEVRGNKVRLGFTAPPEVPIRRDELGSPADGGEPVPGRPPPGEGQP